MHELRYAWCISASSLPFSVQVGTSSGSEQQESVCRASQQHARGNLIHIWVLNTSNEFFLRCTLYTEGNQNVVHFVCCALLLHCEVPLPPPPPQIRTFFSENF